MKNVFFKVFLLINCSLLLSCSEEKSAEDSAPLLKSTEKINVQISKEVLDEMVQSLPQPIEIAKIISNSKIDMSKGILIPSNNIDKYETKYAQALAFGAYGVDLGYINLNNKTLYVLEYLGAIKDLSNSLKVNQFFDFQTMSHLAKNRNNSDSLIQLSTQNFNKIDQFLRDQDRGELSVLILIGAWMEGMNMFGEIYKSTNSADITKRIGEQKVVFENVYLILNKLNKVEYFAKLQKAFLPIKTTYDKIKITYNYKGPLMKEVDGQMVLEDQTETQIDFTDQDISNVIVELKKLRNQFFFVK
jgi:hypothetical protein